MGSRCYAEVCSPECLGLHFLSGSGLTRFLGFVGLIGCCDTALCGFLRVLSDWDFIGPSSKLSDSKPKAQAPSFDYSSRTVKNGRLGHTVSLQANKISCPRHS